MLVGAHFRQFVASATVASAVAATTLTIGVVAAPAVASARGFACSSSSPTYTVARGDGWLAISDRLDVRFTALLDANDAQLDDVISPGDRLCLPSGANLSGVCDGSYTVRTGDGWLAIADRADTTVRALLDANGSTLDDTIHPGEVICLPAGSSTPSSSASAGSSTAGTTYTVARGDSWSTIADRADTTLRSLLAANDASSATVIVPGQRISLPEGAAQPASADEPLAHWVELDALPMQGPCGYGDTWHDARSGGRQHLGTDVFTSRGSYVYAVVDGRLTDRDWDQPGQISGNAWTLTAPDGTFYFYAHLSDFNPALRVGSTVSAGQIIGWMGATGNASAPHLHFEIHPRGGAAINPYPILRAEGGCNNGTPYTQPGGWVPD